MSFYCWEQGSVKIPEKHWAALKKTVRDAWNKEQDKKFKDSLILYEEVLLERRKKKWKNFFDYESAEFSIVRRLKLEDISLDYNSKGKPFKPKKKNFPHANNKKTSFIFNGAELGFINKTLTVEWYVEEDNHAVEHARNHPIAKVFFEYLDTIEWTTKTGGIFIGSDEHYRRRSEDSGVYTNKTYGSIHSRKA